MSDETVPHGDPAINRVRYTIGFLGLLAGLYGAYVLLSRQDFDRLRSVAVWMVGGVVLHDFILAPIVIGLAWAFRHLPMHWRRPATIALIVFGSVSILAIPVLTRLGARSDNPTLLDRPYMTSWLVVAAVSVILVVAAGLIGARISGHRAGGDHGKGAGS